MGACKAAASYGTVDPAVVQQRHLFARSVREGALEQALRFAEAALLVEVHRPSFVRASVAAVLSAARARPARSARRARPVR